MNSVATNKRQLRQLKIWLGLLMGILFVSALPVTIDLYIDSAHSDSIYYDLAKTPKQQVAIVLGAAVWGKEPSPILADRLDTAIQLYRNSKVDKVLVSGDHGKKHYDEVNTMASYLYKRGVKKKDIFLDHAGFRTFDTMARAKEVFKVKSATIVTQIFHLPRSIYLAEAFDIRAVGFAANKRIYSDAQKNRTREFFARIKAWLDLNILNTKPKFLGDPIPITGSGLKSWDQK